MKSGSIPDRVEVLSERIVLCPHLPQRAGMELVCSWDDQQRERPACMTSAARMGTAHSDGTH